MRCTTVLIATIERDGFSNFERGLAKTALCVTNTCNRLRTLLHLTSFKPTLHFGSIRFSLGKMKN